MTFFAISVLAGVLTVLAPCILPLLPIVIGASEEGEKKGISKRALVVIGTLSLSVILFTILLKATTLLISIPQTFWTYFSGSVIILVGFAILVPSFWTKLPLVSKLSRWSNQAVGAGYQKKSYKGDALVGFALGPVFTTCSPTYLFIVATVLPAAFIVGFFYLVGFTIGLAVALLLIAYFGQRIVNSITARMQTAGRVKQVFGLLIIVVGIAVFTGYDKKLETAILDLGYGATIQFEDSLIERFAPQESSEVEEITDPVTSSEYESIILAGGCFWCTEAYFQELEGVADAVSGYVGGDETTATYLQVAKGMTKHREAVLVTYDPTNVSIEEILDVYWSHIDPTDTEGQFADKGFQYTTAIYFMTDKQKVAAMDSRQRLEASKLFDEPIATEILSASDFFVAEEYHQDYYKKAADHYERYKKGSGRAGFVEETWARDAAITFLESEQTTATN